LGEYFGQEKNFVAELSQYQNFSLFYI